MQEPHPAARREAGKPVKRNRAVLVIPPGWDLTWLRQIGLLVAFCGEQQLRPVSVLHDDPQAAVPLLADRFADVIVVPFADRTGMAELAELAAAAAGGCLRYVRERERPNRMEKSINPIIGRMLDRSMKPEDIAAVLDVDPSIVLEEMVRSGRSVPRPRGERPVPLRGRGFEVRARVIG